MLFWIKMSSKKDFLNFVQTIFLLLVISNGVLLKLSEGTSLSSKFNLPEHFNVSGAYRTRMELGELTKQYNLVDLGPSSPDFLPPIHFRDALWNATNSDNSANHQYTDTAGHPKIRKSIANFYGKLINNDLDPGKNVIVTVGASEALFVSLLAHTNPGDEWIIIEPAYDFYVEMIRCANGVPKIVLLRPTKSQGKITSRDWVYDKEELAGAFNDKTKGIIVNTPHNPTGKVFTREEMQFIADLATEWNTLIIADEVYEWLIFTSNKHIRMATLPDMYERTITISSASKTYSVTGWRVGWAYGPKPFIDNMKIVHSEVLYTGVTPMQIAMGTVLEDALHNLGHPDSYLVRIAEEYKANRDYLVNAFEKIGMNPVIPDGGYYILANWTGLTSKVRLDEEDGKTKDMKFVKWLIKNVGVSGVPGSMFYSEDNENSVDHEAYVRYCIAKKNETLKKASQKLLEWVQH